MVIWGCMSILLSFFSFVRSDSLMIQGVCWSRIIHYGTAYLICTYGSRVGCISLSSSAIANNTCRRSSRLISKLRSRHTTFQQSPLNCPSPLGYHHLYGWRASRGDIASRRPNCQGAPEHNMLWSSGTCITCYHGVGIPTDTCTRHICGFYLEILNWRAATTTVQYSRLSGLDPKCETTRMGHYSWSHW